MSAFIQATIESPRKEKLVIHSVSLSNFRGYKSLSLDNLPRFNFLIGPSGSGKTALLEALWIVGGASPEIYFRMRAMRGAQAQMQIRPERSAYEAFFADIFSNTSTSESPSARIDIFDSEQGPRSLTISYGSQAQLPMDIDLSRRGTMAVRPIVFTWTVDEKDYECPLNFVNNQISVPKPPSVYPAMFISSSFPVDSSENATRLSELRIKGKVGPVLNAVRKIYSRIEDLSPEVVGGQQMVYAQLKDVPQQLPVQVVSSGINKYLSILLAINQYEGGAVLIDELENGFYYEDYEGVVQGISDFCTEKHVQLFASTHSDEMIRAIRRAMVNREDSMAILRTHCSDGSCTARVMPGPDASDAIAQGIELR